MKSLTKASNFPFRDLCRIKYPRVLNCMSHTCSMGAKNLECIWNKTYGINHGFVNFSNPTGCIFFSINLKSFILFDLSLKQKAALAKRTAFDEIIIPVI